MLYCSWCKKEITKYICRYLRLLCIIIVFFFLFFFFFSSVSSFNIWSQKHDLRMNTLTFRIHMTVVLHRYRIHSYTFLHLVDKSTYTYISKTLLLHVIFLFKKKTISFEMYLRMSIRLLGTKRYGCIMSKTKYA